MRQARVTRTFRRCLLRTVRGALRGRTATSETCCAVTLVGAGCRVSKRAGSKKAVMPQLSKKAKQLFGSVSPSVNPSIRQPASQPGMSFHCIAKGSKSAGDRELYHPHIALVAPTALLQLLVLASHFSSHAHVPSLVCSPFVFWSGVFVVGLAVRLLCRRSWVVSSGTRGVRRLRQYSSRGEGCCSCAMSCS